LVDRHLEDLTPGDLAFCLRQGIAVHATAGRAMELLSTQPAMEAELFPGDLLLAALHAERKGWLSAEQRSALRDACVAAVAGFSTLEQEVLPSAQEFIRQHDVT
jgi:hypothetical protein